ncbi:uncharacterized protein BXIN_2105 [Babesia sp. Xinjiang]|uniref:uncharacterized protein n=1 Tax=Babesia sp. Xinjiang TaxID=462227 RepID=UPI000A2363D7|nr:uncharacterized protein BXIN_2105 [Babesia sp. Xinjiang]ORM40623.1 hypothetical protein BXIN_2105 [Babesia sp. Xinjiang]
MCMLVKRYFQVPWHAQDARAYNVLTLIFHPLLSSLFAIAISLNVMVFMQMYSRSLSHWCINVPLSIELLKQAALESKIDSNSLKVVRVIVVVSGLVVILLTVRLGLVTVALVEAMMHGGMLWDLDDAKERHIGDHPRAFSISVPEEE